MTRRGRPRKPIRPPERPKETIHHKEVNPDLLTVFDVAARLNLSPTTIRRMLARGELRSIRIGTAVRISRASYEALVERVTAEPVA